MRLQVNLIPVIAYALVTMFAKAAGWTNEVDGKQPQQTQFSVAAAANELKIWNKNVYVTGQGQIYLSNNFQNDLPVWIIPGTTGVSLPFIRAGKNLVCREHKLCSFPS